jgi:CRP-like cAMP-binding protein
MAAPGMAAPGRRGQARAMDVTPARAGERPGSGAVPGATVVTSRSAGHSDLMDWPVLASLPLNERRRLVARLRRQAYRRDEVIFHQGDPADTLHLIATGHVSVRVTLRGGEYVVVAILGPGNTFGELALVGEAQTRGATIVALEPTETLALGRHEFERLRTSYPGIDRFLVGLLSARLEKVNTNLLEALYVPAERRVMRRLLDLCELYAGDDQHIMIPVTQEMLASIAGTTRPTANQVLRRLVASEIVAVNRSQITVLDRRGLQHRANHVGPTP